MNKADHRALGIKAYNRCWTLLERETRSADDDHELLTLAFTSRYHWHFAGGEEQFVIGDWMISRAAAAVDQPQLSLIYARRALDRSVGTSLPDWLHASVAEGMARAFAACGDEGQRDEWIEKARGLLDRIGDLEDRQLIASQLATVPR